jgi:hypothetical protein
MQICYADGYKVVLNLEASPDPSKYLWLNLRLLGGVERTINDESSVH